VKAFLDEAMVFLNKHWAPNEPASKISPNSCSTPPQPPSSVWQRGGRESKYERYERSLNRFEVRAYYFSFTKVRTAATKSKSEVLQASKELFSDTAFTSSIESTTKSVENYRTRFGKYEKMLQDALGIRLPSIEIAIQSK
jgi:hypothetical protein